MQSLDKEKPLSRIAKFGRQHQKPAEGRQVAVLTVKDQINFRHTVIIGLIITALIYVFNFANALERDIFMDSQMDVHLTWNMIAFFMKGLVCSILIPIVFYLLHFVLYFVREPRHTLTKLEEYYTKILLYCGLSVLLMVAIPGLLLYYLHLNKLNALSYLIIVLVLLFISVAFYMIISNVSKRPNAIKGMWTYLGCMVIFVLGFALYPSVWNLWFPSISVSQPAYYASQDQIAVVGVTGNVTDAYLVHSLSPESKDDRIRLRELYYAKPRYHQFLIDFTDPRMTAGTYDIVVSYRDEGVLPIFTSTKERPVKTMTKRITYIFDGDDEAKAAYVAKYIALLKREGTPPGMTAQSWDETLVKLANTLRYSHYDGWNPHVRAQYEYLSKLLPVATRAILDNMMADPVISPLR